MKKKIFRIVILLFVISNVSISSYAQLNAIYNINNAVAGSIWIKLGTLTAPQGGETVSFKFYGGAGFNALNSQNAYTELFFRTSNGSVVDANGYGFSAFAVRFGYHLGFINLVKIVPNSSGANATTYDIYVGTGSYVGKSLYTVTGGSSVSWTHNATITTEPASAYVVPTEFRVLCDTYLGNGSLFASTNGNVGIGTLAPQAKLAVKGDILAQKVKVTQTGWADFVFDCNYALPTLQELEQFIKEHKHLPGVPSAKEVEKDGIDLGNNQAILLQKIEELSLYVIEQNKRIEKQEKEIEELKAAQKK
ncbi:hypothetical protein DVR12_16985 [Chitinophaga silvatica]|uniref:Cell wall anchor protein n=1 Tax=Chitinophaga silvatica TaxID=2282649 RepID=A0A3E1Y7I3_9BACT|nr:hypothetical protein [Chitinophaga silvatica]RFS21037.1 hypothetical protein DVR12_16985 [Chitinophaga silvatica]